MNSIRNSHYDYLGSINDNGEIRNDGYNYLGRIDDDGRVYSDSNEYILRFYKNGEIRSSDYGYLGSYNIKGEIFDDKYNYIGTCKYITKFINVDDGHESIFNENRVEQIRNKEFAHFNNTERTTSYFGVFVYSLIFFLFLIVCLMIPFFFFVTILEKKDNFVYGLFVIIPIFIIAIALGIKCKEEKLTLIIDDMLYKIVLYSTIVDFVICFIHDVKKLNILMWFFVALVLIIISSIIGLIMCVITLIKNKILIKEKK